MPIRISMAAVIQILTHGNSGKGMAPEISIVKDKNLRNTARDIHDKFYHTNSQLSNARDVNKCLDSIRYYILFNRNVHRVSFLWFAMLCSCRSNPSRITSVEDTETLFWLSHNLWIKPCLLFDNRPRNTRQRPNTQPTTKPCAIWRGNCLGENQNLVLITSANLLLHSV